MPGIDPSIALQVRQPQAPDLLGSYAQLLQIQHAKAMQPLQEQALQQQIATQRDSSAALQDERRSVIAQHQEDIAHKQRVQQSQDTIDKLMSTSMKTDETTGVSSFDRHAFEQGLIQGGLGHMYPQLDETLNKLDESQAKINAERDQSVARSIFAVQQAGNTPGAVQMAAAYLKKNRLIDDSHLQPVLDAVHQDESPENIGRVMQALGQGMPAYQSLVNTEEKRKADLAKSSAETQKLTAEADNLKKYGRPNAPEPPKLQLHPVMGPDGKTTMATFNPDSGALMAGGQNVTTTAKPIPPASVQAAAAVQPAAGGPENPLARAMSEYKVPPISPRSMATPAGAALMGQVLAINPAYEASKYPERAKMRIQFSSGPQSQTLNSLNTAIEHLDQFVDVAKALGNGKFQPGNQAYNWLKATFGDSAPTNFDGIRSIMSGELASAFKKSGATDQEIASVEKSIASKNSTSQLIDYATKVAIPALGSKAATFDEQYHRTMGADDPWSAIYPKADAVLRKHGYDPSAATMGGGSSPAAPVAPVAAPKVGDKVGRFEIVGVK